MGTRLELQGELLELAPKAYYQPPSSEKIKYPCFVYGLSKIQPQYADNKIYKKFPNYTVTYISLNVDDKKVDQILDHFQYCKFERHYVADGLHHYAFNLFY